MVRALRGKGRLSERKARLFAVAVCRQVWHLLDGQSRCAVEVAEGFAEGKSSRNELFDARSAAEVVYAAAGQFRGPFVAARCKLRKHVKQALARAGATNAAALAASEPLRFPWDYTTDRERDDGYGLALALEHEARVALYQTHSPLLRDIFFNPFLPPPAIAPQARAWNDGCVKQLAAGISEDRDFSPERMGILADALEEAGVTDEVVLTHCRGQLLRRQAHQQRRPLPAREQPGDHPRAGIALDRLEQHGRPDPGRPGHRRAGPDLAVDAGQLGVRIDRGLGPQQLAGVGIEDPQGGPQEAAGCPSTSWRLEKPGNASHPGPRWVPATAVSCLPRRPRAGGVAAAP
jgi:hypothetical protein